MEKEQVTRCRYCAVPLSQDARYCSPQCLYWYYVGEPVLREPTYQRYAQYEPGDTIEQHHAMTDQT